LAGVGVAKRKNKSRRVEAHVLPEPVSSESSFSSDQLPALSPAQPEAASERGVSLGLATHISWALHLSEEDAKRATDVVEQWRDDISEGSAAYERCESPAERLFLLGFTLDDSERPVTIDWEDNELIYGSPDRRSRPFAANLEAVVNDDFEGFTLHQQAEIGPYRVDFLLEDKEPADDGRPNWGVVIEIDGHDFHERTKEQAAYDKRRDRFLASAGYHVLRFTGSEVYADPVVCTRDALQIALTLRIRDNKRQERVLRAYDAGYKSGYEAANPSDGADAVDPGAQLAAEAAE
jgi:very-short-patch-repair endonuclease